MTVCIAQMIGWQYAEGDVGRAILTASDREITAGDVEYEPNQQKICHLAPNVLLLIAGDFAVHSEAIYRTREKLKSDPQTDPRAIAEKYAASVGEVKRQQAEKLYLAPLGLTVESFHTRQREFSPELANKITSQLQAYQGTDTEALIVGMNDKIAHICMIDVQGQVSVHDDVGFAAIGIGAWHAKSAFMQAKYTNTTFYAGAFAILYLAKKRAEIAPGVGKTTDYHLITRVGWSPVLPRLIDKAHEVYADYEKKHLEWAIEAIGKLNDALLQPVPQLEESDSCAEVSFPKSPTTSSRDQT